MFNLLFLCTGNSARSILAEAILNKAGAGRFSGFSAGSNPVGKVNPMTLNFLRTLGYSVDHLRSKPWEKFSGSESPKLDLVITVCDNAAGESCPIWHGQPKRSHWSTPDPAAIQSTREEQTAALATAYKMLEVKIIALTELPIEDLPPSELETHLVRIAAITIPPMIPTNLSLVSGLTSK